MKKKIKILYQFATAKGKTKNGEEEIKKRKIFLENNIGSNSKIPLSVPK